MHESQQEISGSLMSYSAYYEGQTIRTRPLACGHAPRSKLQELVMLTLSIVVDVKQLADHKPQPILADLCCFQAPASSPQALVMLIMVLVSWVSCFEDLH